MSHIPKVLHALARLVKYPDESTVQSAELLYIVLQGELTAAAKDAALFGEYVEQHPLAELEEVYTQTFDINPLSALEVGWHLFGEEYARGMFLVRMRAELRKYEIPESHELPDHLAHALAIVAGMPDDEATWFVRACVQPAVEKMNQALRGKDTPYRHVIHCLSSVLSYVWGEPSASSDDGASQSAQRSRPLQSDPLHAFPVADVTFGCNSRGAAPVELVPLRMAYPTDVAGAEPRLSTTARLP